MKKTRACFGMAWSVWGLATGVSRLGGLDWFEAGAGHILKRERAGKSEAGEQCVFRRT